MVRKLLMSLLITTCAVFAQDRKTISGARAAYTCSYASGMAFTVNTYDGHSITGKRHENRFGAGHGFEFGIVSGFRFTNTLHAIAELNAGYRKPVVTDVVETSEVFINVPVMARFIVRERWYAQGGLLLGAVLPGAAGIHWAWEPPAAYSQRAPFDCGVIFGVGLLLNRYASIDVNISRAINSFDGGKGHHLYQMGLGSAFYF